MASPADKRLLELLDKWLASLELHTEYSSLDDDSYWKIQPWAEHQRPSRWIVDLARQKTIALKAEVEERIKSGDERFSDSLEQMIFLANLVGSEHIERFIPIAEPRNNPAPAQNAQDGGITGTREMPRFKAASQDPPETAREQVIADAVRLLQWGRKWFELPELVARMADRPPLAEVRRILKENKPAIEQRAGK